MGSPIPLLPALWSLPMYMVLAYLPHFIRVPMMRKAKAYNHKDPRTSVARVSDSPTEESTEEKEQRQFILRASGAHSNALEFFPFFAAAILSATVAGVRPEIIDAVATVGVGSRALHLYLYLTNKAGFRTLAFYSGWFTSLGLLTYAAFVARRN